MDLELIQSDEFQKLVERHEQDDINKLALKFSKQKDFPFKDFIFQVEGRQKSKNKIPLFYSKKIIYPPSISLEQCSSQETAQYKSSLFKGNLLVDLTGGWGVDAYFFSQSFKNVIYVEKQQKLASIAKHNFSQLNAEYIDVWNEEAETALEKLSGYKPDLIYIDPARRDELNRKVHSFSDCSPDVISLRSKIFNATSKVLIKASPMLDIKAALDELKYVEQVWIVSLNDECKELLFLLDEKVNDKQPVINCVELAKKSFKFQFTYEDEKESNSSIGAIDRFLFKPHSSVIKAGAFKSLAMQFDLLKLHVSTHLYTANEIRDFFPGSIFEVIDTFKFDKEKIKKIGNINIITKNVPYNSSALKQELKIKESTDQWLFIYRDQEEKIICALTKRIVQ